ncbi:MAG: membrane protein insertase YidC [Planctomycetia bacterium]|nr:membrane protein insertase YidC [Planctomycetia bacterium]
MQTFFPPVKPKEEKSDTIVEVMERIQSQKVEKTEEVKPTESPAPETPAAELPTPVETQPAETYLTLGNTESQYRMRVTLTNRGAAVACAEMRDIASMNDEADFKGGYLGSLNFEKDVLSLAAPADANATKSEPGFVVQVVGAGTPAQKAGLLPGDRIVRLNDVEVASMAQLREQVQAMRPGTEVSLAVVRDGQEQTIPITLAREPVRVIQPENGDTLSFLTTLYHYDDKTLDTPVDDMGDRIAKDDPALLRRYLDLEIPGLGLRTRNWEIETQTENSVTFLHHVPHYGLEVRKTYTLAEIDPNNGGPDQSYHLTLAVTVKNVGTQPHLLAVQQDGPTGLPTEGHWFCSKVGRKWFEMVGIRDVIIGFEDASTPTTVSCSNIADGVWGRYEENKTRPIKYIGVDAQYFSSILIPDQAQGNTGIHQYTTLRCGAVPDPWEITTNTSCRVRLNDVTLSPGESASQNFTIFIGPKRPELLSRYSLDNVVYYGWFSWIAVLLSGILDFFYSFTGNYGIAILLLTVVVRLLMFPLSKKQVQGALIMQKLQPEMKKIQEKFEDPMERQKAQMELFRKHKYNPMSGCWVMLIQLPIFIALYRALLVNVELRLAPLFTDSIRFCSNLAAPDMLFCWKPFVWTTISTGYGFFGLGPYLNLLPVVTIVIFIIQQKVFMPPAVDDQARMQQKIMTYMMVFMGFLFFKVPSGLCLYFIVSSLWGLAERQLMPKAESLETVPQVIDAKDLGKKKETFFQKVARLAGKSPNDETPMERNRRRKGKNRGN